MLALRVEEGVGFPPPRCQLSDQRSSQTFQ